MTRIRVIHVRQQLRDLSEPELWISVEPEQQADGLEVHGRIVGPRCLYATTVEVAYPLRPFPRLPEGLPALSRRVVIPEASFWDPQSPFLYEGPVELWQGGTRCDEATVRVGLKVTTLSQRGFRLNGRLLDVKGCVASPTLEEATTLRHEGCNILIAPVRDGNRDLWDHADRIGLLLLGRLPAGPVPVSLLHERMQQPSCLGWLAAVEQIEALSAARVSGFRGVWLEAKPEQLPGGVEFVLAAESLLPALEGLALPKLFLGQEGASNGHPSSSKFGWATS
jgi:hypothetical protein